MTQAIREVAMPPQSIFKRDPSWQAFAMLRTVFTIAPIVFGLDKFFNILTDWTKYVSPQIVDTISVTPEQFMYVVGVIEIIAGLLVLFVPKWGSIVVAAWLLGIIINLLTIPGYFDVALRDFGLLVAALALNRLAVVNARVWNASGAHDA